MLAPAVVTAGAEVVGAALLTMVLDTVGVGDGVTVNTFV